MENYPVNYTDDSGHVPCGLLGDPDDSASCQQAKTPLPLPDSQVSILLTSSEQTANGGTTTRISNRGNGVIVAPNAILTHNHLFPEVVTEESIQRLFLRHNNGSFGAAAGSFTVFQGQDLGSMDNALILIVFENDIGGAVAPMASASSMTVGTTAYQTVTTGLPDGLYPTQITDNEAVFYSADGNFSGVHVSPDATIPGDSGNPLYVDNAVVGVNNQGDGEYGAITNVALLQHLIEVGTDELRGRNHGAR